MGKIYRHKRRPRATYKSHKIGWEDKLKPKDRLKAVQADREMREGYAIGSREHPEELFLDYAYSDEMASEYQMLQELIHDPSIIEQQLATDNTYGSPHEPYVREIVEERIRYGQYYMPSDIDWEE